jgi:hypothetical protein
MHMRLLMIVKDAAKKFMPEGGLVMQPEFVGKTEVLYLWSLIREPKTFVEYACRADEMLAPALQRRVRL